MRASSKRCSSSSTQGPRSRPDRRRDERKHHGAENEQQEQHHDEGLDRLGTHPRGEQARKKRPLERDVASQDAQTRLPRGERARQTRKPLHPHPDDIAGMNEANDAVPSPTPAHGDAESDGGNAERGKQGERGVRDEKQIGTESGIHDARRMARIGIELLRETLKHTIPATVSDALRGWLDAGAPSEHAEDAAAVLVAGAALAGRTILMEPVVVPAAAAHPLVGAAMHLARSGASTGRGPNPDEAQATLWRTLEIQAERGPQAVLDACAESFEHLRTTHRRALLAQALSTVAARRDTLQTLVAAARLFADYASTEQVVTIEDATLEACADTCRSIGPEVIARAIEQTETIAPLIPLYVAARRLEGREDEAFEHLSKPLKTSCAVVQDMLDA